MFLDLSTIGKDSMYGPSLTFRDKVSARCFLEVP